MSLPSAVAGSSALACSPSAVSREYQPPATRASDKAGLYVHHVEGGVELVSRPERTRLERLPEHATVRHVSVRHCYPGDGAARDAKLPETPLYAVLTFHRFQPASRSTLNDQNAMAVKRTWPFPAFVYGSRINSRPLQIGATALRPG